MLNIYKNKSHIFTLIYVKIKTNKLYFLKGVRVSNNIVQDNQNLNRVI